MSDDRLKFRAWLEVPVDTPKGTTVCGFYVYDVTVLPERNQIFPKGGYVGFPLETLKESLGSYRELENEIVEKLDINGNCEISEYLYAEPITIEQSTGLEDDDGHPIYEGDILFCEDLADAYTGETGMGRVEWDDVLLRYMVRTDLEYLSFDDLGSSILVKGNIHENEKLLKGESI